jgi:predicted phage baseplate assembly protein
MPLIAPNLDDRTFDSLVAEAKSLIPRYAPEWTDYNESDPGITLIELFAWMTEIIIYRLNQVPELNYIQFLKMLGIELTPAAPARVDLTFKLGRDDLDSVIIPKGTQVSAQGDTQPIVFELDDALIALGAKLAAVQSFDGFGYSVETTKNSTPGQMFYPFGAHARQGSALMLGFDSPVDFTAQQVDLACFISTQGVSQYGVQCQLDLSVLPVPVSIVWEYWDTSYWQPILLDKDGTRAFTQNGHVYFEGPGSAAKKDKIGRVDQALYWIRARLDSGAYDSAPQLESILTCTATASQAVTARDEVIGGSDGRPSQVFHLANQPVVVLDTPINATAANGSKATVTSLQLEIDEGRGFEVWQEVDNFFASGPADPHFVLNRNRGDVMTGDGTHGRIPVANPANPTGNVVARYYRYGGGKNGNVPANAATQLQTSVDSVDSVTNLRPALGGTDEETVDEAKLRAPLELKSKERAVTAEDFEFLATQTPGVHIKRAKALPLVHPKFRGAPIPGVVTVVVVPDNDAPNPTPGPVTLQIVCAWLNQHRLLTSEVFVTPPVYHKVRIEAKLIATPDADLAQVTKDVTAALTTYFHPLKGSNSGTGWEFGRDIYFSEVYRVVLQTKGVDRVFQNQLIIWLDNNRQLDCRDVCIETGALVYSDGHDIHVSYNGGN